MLFTAKLGMLAAAGASAALLAGVVPAQASTSSAGNGRTISGPEFIQGAAYGRAAIASNPAVPVRLSGLVWAHGLLVTTSGPPANIYTNRGALYTRSGRTISQHEYVNPRSCFGVFSERFYVYATGGTGAFWGARGSGQASVLGGSFLPRNPNGTCNAQGTSTNPRGAFINVRAQLWLTVRRHRHR